MLLTYYDSKAEFADVTPSAALTSSFLASIFPSFHLREKKNAPHHHRCKCK